MQMEFCENCKSRKLNQTFTEANILLEEQSLQAIEKSIPNLQGYLKKKYKYSRIQIANKNM